MLLFHLSSIKIASASFPWDPSGHEEKTMRSHLKKFIAYLLAVSFAFTQISPVYAGMIGTQTLIDQASVKIDRERLKDALERSEVRKLLADHGVTVEQAKVRIDALTNEEVRQLAADFDKLPAGAGVIELLFISGLVAALVVVILEGLGIIDVFTAF
jgi:hypothetical protein